MSQDMISLDLTDEDLTSIDQDLTGLETTFSGFVGLTSAQRRTLLRMGNKSEAFCRQTLSALAQNPQVVPPSLKLAEAQADLVALDRLRPRLQRLQRLSERAADTEILLGSDVMRCALDGYALLKVSGRNQGLEGLRRDLGARFAKSSRVATPDGVPDESPEDAPLPA